ncbi:MAG: rod shape-determining protein RodA [Chitinivibrionia bacterium]|jgi:rod shape determining protein RodA|nr:rod shape-determining protein RodA [Chitinivibrionia bacterium]
MRAKNIAQRTFDMPFFLMVLLLWLIGNALVCSAVAPPTDAPSGLSDLFAYIGNSFETSPLFRSQVIWTIMGIIIVLIMVSVPVEWYYKIAPFFYVATILLLIAVLTSGVSSKGAGRWIAIGGIKLQPSEFAKIGLLLMLARHFARYEISLKKPITLLAPGIIILIPFALVIRQPDLSTTLALIAMSLPIFYWVGLKLVEILYLISPGISALLAVLPLIVAFVRKGTVETVMTSGVDAVTTQGSQLGIIGTIPWAIFFATLCVLFYFFRTSKIILVLVISLNLLSASASTLVWENWLNDYQKVRVISFINPQLDPKGSGWQVIQSQIAIGSGKFSGKGYLKGTQVNLAYLPEQHTDFIFSVLGEQFGFYGCVGVILLFFMLIARALHAVTNINERFINVLVVGATSLLVYHIFVNIAMGIGLMPVTGLPLPFLSYGGSFTLTVSMLVGLILSARAQDI